MTNKTLIFGLLALAAVCGGCIRHSTEPGYRINPLTDMQEPVPYESFSPNPVFADGKTMQVPVAGTVPQGFIPYPIDATDAGWETAGRELDNPFVANDKTLARGKAMFETFCSQCHGPQGKGDGKLIPRYPNPPAFTAANVLPQADGNYFHTITFGRRNMPAHGSQIEAADRWKIILYIRELQNRPQ